MKRKGNKEGGKRERRKGKREGEGGRVNETYGEGEEMGKGEGGRWFRK